MKKLVADLSTSFATYEKALFATKGLVSSEQEESARDDTQENAGLTKRQSQILSHIRQGASNQMIAEALGITEGTVKLHVSAILKTLNVRNRTEAASH